MASIAVAALLSVHVQSTPVGAQVRGALELIRDADGAISKGVSKGDASAVAVVYAADAEALPPGSSPIRGRQGIENLWRSLFAAGVTTFEVKIENVEANNGLAEERGNYTMKRSDGQIFQRGTYLNVWKRESGQWKLLRNAWTPEK